MKREKKEEMPPIVVDTREQLPYPFDGSVIGTVRSGDYSLLGFEDRVGIERKSLADAYGCVGRDRDRFRRQFERLAELEFGAVVVEATLRQALEEPPRFSRVSPRAVVSTLLAWNVRFGVTVVWAGDRDYSAAATRALLRFWWQDLRTKEAEERAEECLPTT